MRSPFRHEVFSEGCSGVVLSHYVDRWYSSYTVFFGMGRSSPRFRSVSFFLLLLIVATPPPPKKQKLVNYCTFFIIFQY